MQTLGEIEEVQQLGELESTEPARPSTTVDTSYWLVYYDKEETVGIKKIGVLFKSSSEVETTEDILKRYFSTGKENYQDSYDYWIFKEVESVPEIDPHDLQYLYGRDDASSYWCSIYKNIDKDDINYLFVEYKGGVYLIQNIDNPLDVAVSLTSINLNQFGVYTISEVYEKALVIQNGPNGISRYYFEFKDYSSTSFQYRGDSYNGYYIGNGDPDNSCEDYYSSSGEYIYTYYEGD